MELRRRFSPLHLLLISINGMVGSAWLFAPLYAAKIAGPYAIYAWVIAGIATIVIALTFAELSVFLPIAGGSSRFPLLSHGTFTSFIMSWIAWLSSLTMAPIEVQAVLQYASTYFTALTHIQNGIPTLTHIGLIWATLVMGLLCIMNVASFKGLVRFNFGLFLFKVVVIILTIAWLTKTRFNVTNFQALPTANTSTWHAMLAAVASGGIAFAFTGFKHGVELAGETKNHQVAIPLAIVGSIICCLLLYLGLQIAFIGAISPTDLAQGWQHLSFKGDVGPFAGIAASLGLLWLLKLLYIDAAISPLGAGLIYVTSTARILYAMSKSGFVPAVFAKLNKQHFPIYAILLNFILGMFLFLPLPGWQAMVNFLVSAMVISYAMGPIALLCMRRQLPLEKRTFKLPAATFLCLCAFYFCNLISYWTGWETIWKLDIAIAIGVLFFLFGYLRNRVPKEKLSLKSLWWIAPYLIGMSVISYLGSFGGRNIISFGWDFLVIGVFSIIILYLAVISRTGLIQEQYDLYKSEELAAP